MFYDDMFSQQPTYRQWNEAHSGKMKQIGLANEAQQLKWLWRTNDSIWQSRIVHLSSWCLRHQSNLERSAETAHFP
jgi:hypothetical protein